MIENRTIKTGRKVKKERETEIDKETITMRLTERKKKDNLK